MRNLFDEKILEEANTWIKSNQKVVLATVIKTWGSSPLQTGSKMIISEKNLIDLILKLLVFKFNASNSKLFANSSFSFASKISCCLVVPQPRTKIIKVHSISANKLCLIRII